MLNYASGNGSGPDQSLTLLDGHTDLPETTPPPIDVLRKGLFARLAKISAEASDHDADDLETNGFNLAKARPSLLPGGARKSFKSKARIRFEGLPAVTGGGVYSDYVINLSALVDVIDTTGGLSGWSGLSSIRSDGHFPCSGFSEFDRVDDGTYNKNKLGRRVERNARSKNYSVASKGIVHDVMHVDEFLFAKTAISA
jgi:hypothetical protein